jgi:hypothetical protein
VTELAFAALPPHPTRDLIEKRIKQRLSLIIVIIALEWPCIGEPDADKREEGFALDRQLPPPREIPLIQSIKPRLDGIGDGVRSVMDEDALEGIIGGAREGQTAQLGLVIKRASSGVIEVERELFAGGHGCALKSGELD